ncbi:MAG: toprim domain-containing protein [Rhodobacteraceae bacterium]|jgi:hypothetical protein|uniref:DUF7146 domain-containing protein n=1 Tax=unclassified Sulfitobacter TaxID=196795 RepID=UPI0023E1A8BD|nr:MULTISPECIES: toprim domain-containing protein [unclassified Sulfitobacter]MBV1897684.1 toprim domain-containing protein [Paracoccaceae bacterium]MDF3416435.1 hypothetical protein [Sulfitobacter sp. KE5]MDF3423915.1 hypothetical protein [Sulfitobacter sp. KE43]MDF3434981.1 hypothetical protein [Sulfitobacter sp. KE42]MDF3460620.1 hypothetical protein [Sulfitobacter sp. S74]
MTNYGSKFERLDPGALARGLARHAEAFCRHWFPEGRKVGNYWQMADISGAKGRSLTIRLKSHGSRKAGKWTDHQNGDHGDLLDLLHYHLEPVAYPDLLRQAADYLGEAPVIPDDGTSDYEPAVASNRQAAAGRKLFSYGRPIRNTLAEAYLRGRGIARFGPALAFHTNVYLRAQDGTRLEIPALLAAITDNAGTVTGCSRVFLNARTGGLAAIEAPKRVLGRLHGNAIRFGETRSCTDLLAGEGLENTLSVGTALPRAALACCLTANHLAAFTYPASIRRLWIARDNDEAGARAATRLADRADADGIEPLILTPERDDFNLDLTTDGVTQLRQRLAAFIDAHASEHDLWPSA